MKISGEEKFTLNGDPLGFDLIDFWRFRYSNIYDMQSVIAEFLVAKALGQTEAHNTDYWTLYDIEYQEMRVEVKETSYYHPWNKNGKISKNRTFGITMANSIYEAKAKGTADEHENKFERQNDLYVFCLNTGTTREDSYPLELKNWEFYVIPTFIINERCGKNKSISLERVRKLAKLVRYEQLREEIDDVVDLIRQWQERSLYKNE